MNTTIQSAIKQLEQKSLSNEDLLVLLEYYIVAHQSDHVEPERKETARIYTLALKRMIMSRME